MKCAASNRELRKKKLFDTVRSIKYLKPGREKGTCELCQRRRFGYYCEVEFKEVEKYEKK